MRIVYTALCRMSRAFLFYIFRLTGQCKTIYLLQKRNLSFSFFLCCFFLPNIKNPREPLITFTAEIVETRQRKSVSLDNVYTLQLRTEDSRVIELGKLPSDVLVQVSIFICEE